MHSKKEVKMSGYVLEQGEIFVPYRDRNKYPDSQLTKEVIIGRGIDLRLLGWIISI